MPVVVIRCPATKHDISTGIETEPEVFARLPHVLSKTECPACGAVHIWWPRIARLNEGPLPAATNSPAGDPTPSDTNRADAHPSPAAAQLKQFCEVVTAAIDSDMVETKLAEALRTLLPVKRRSR